MLILLISVFLARVVQLAYLWRKLIDGSWLHQAKRWYCLRINVVRRLVPCCLTAIWCLIIILLYCFWYLSQLCTLFGSPSSLKFEPLTGISQLIICIVIAIVLLLVGCRRILPIIQINCALSFSLIIITFHLTILLLLL